jgi:hypothetical protein
MSATARIKKRPHEATRLADQATDLRRQRHRGFSQPGREAGLQRRRDYLLCAA